MRENGIVGGQEAYDSFTTGLANSHSARAQTANFCDVADTLVKLAKASADGDLVALAINFSDRPAGVGETCEAAAAVVPAVEIAQAPIAEPNAQVVAATPPKPQSAAAALEAAAVAMQAAAAAMKEQEAGQSPSAVTVPVNASDHAPADEPLPEGIKPASLTPPPP